MQYLVKKWVHEPRGFVTERGEESSAGFVRRVSPEDYRTNLVTFVEGIRNIGATPILIAPPRARTLHPVVIGRKQAPTIKDAIQWHDEYNAILREVAEVTETPLIDLDTTFREQKLFRFFSGDGIHFKTPGREFIAEVLW